MQMANASLPLAKKWPLFLSADDIRGLEGLATYMREESGYAEIQKTKPDTIGYALNDSPAGEISPCEQFRISSQRAGGMDHSGDVAAGQGSRSGLHHVALGTVYFLAQCTNFKRSVNATLLAWMRHWVHGELEACISQRM